MSHSDSDIISGIKAGGARREATAKVLLKRWQGLQQKAAKRYKLSPAQAKDAYVDSILKLLQQVSNDKFSGKSKLSTYFYTILSNQCIDVLRSSTSNKNRQTEEINEFTAIEKSAFELIGRKDLLVRIKVVIGQMGENCQRILVDWGFHGYSMKEIAVRNGLGSVESARSSKYQCMKKLKALLRKEEIS